MNGCIVVSWRRFNVARKEGGSDYEKAHRFPYDSSPTHNHKDGALTSLVAESAPAAISQAGRNPETRK